jgi:endonuclease YncB( thermonuclease family)
MRKIGLLGLAVLAAVGAALIWRVPDRLQRLTEPVVSQLPLPPRAPPPVAAPAPSPPAAPAAPAVPQLAPLPSREVAEIPFHAVPENEEPAKPQPFQMRDSPGLVPARPGARPGSQMGAPMGSQSAAFAAPPPQRQLAGKGEAAGAAGLRVAGQTLRLFGIRPPESSDRCGGSGGAATPCVDRARAVLAGRLSRNTSCRFPAASSDSGAICLDGDGVDLGGLLVAEGLAVADRSQSFDYVGAESIAKSQKRGLWQFR